MRSNVVGFVQFINLLLDHVTRLLDESFSKLSDIHKLEKELEFSPPSSIRTSSEHRKQEHFVTTKRQARFYIPLANEMISLLNKLTAFIPDAFVDAEMVGRLARILNFNQIVLVGDKCNNLKVRNPEKYQFSPPKLLSMIVNIYLNLGMQKEFIIACGKDGRSHQQEIYIKTISVLKKYSMSSVEIDAFEKLFNDIQVAKRQEESEDLGGI